MRICETRLKIQDLKSYLLFVIKEKTLIFELLNLKKNNYVGQISIDHI